MVFDGLARLYLILRFEARGVAYESVVRAVFFGGRFTLYSLS